MGKKQSGKGLLGCLRAARLETDMALLESARAHASQLLSRHSLDPATWPPHLIAMLRDQALPDLDVLPSQLTVEKIS